MKNFDFISPEKVCLDLVQLIRDTAVKKSICFNIDCQKNILVKTDVATLE